MNDFRYAIRSFARTPGFTSVAVLTLALGIGATTAIFSVVNAVLVRPLPYADPDRLVTTRGSLADLRDLKASSRSFDGMAFWASNLYNLQSDTEMQQVRGGQISRDLLPTLGAQPLIGRNFTPDDERQDTVILGFPLWQSHFAGDRAIVGKTINLSGTTFTVVGVMPRSFQFPTADFQLWAPLASIDLKSPEQARNRAFRIFSAVARLKPDATLAQAAAEGQAISSRLAREFPATNEGFTYTIEPLYERLVGQVRPALRILLGTVALLLLIGCANVANLMLARTTVRAREMAVRVALGASRLRLVRQLMVESVSLAAAGGFLGLLVTLWGIDLLRTALEARLPRAEGIHVDGAVLAFSACATLLTGFLFGLAPAFHSTAGPADSLKGAGRGIGEGVRGRGLRRVIVVAEMALAVIVLVGAGLLVRSFITVTGRDPGFAAAGLLSFNVQFVALPNQAARTHIAHELIDQLSRAPGVEKVGAATGLPIVTPQRATRFAIDGLTLAGGVDTALFVAATPGYFASLRTPVVQGRGFDDHDTEGSGRVVLINRTLAAQLFPDGGAIGRRLKLVNPEQSPEWRTIVGIVGDIRYEGLDEAARPTLYTPFAQTPMMWLYVMVRTEGTIESMTKTIRTTLPLVHPSLAAANITPMTGVVAATVAERRFNMLIVSAFAGLALLLASIGIYGVIAYSTAQRRHEIGLRIALGAGRAQVLRLVLSEGVLVAIAGVGLGLAGAMVLSHVMTAVLVDVSPRDPATFAAGATLLFVVGVVASYIPARRAARMEPMGAWRE